MDVTCKNQLSDDELFLYACSASIESIPESDPATVSDLCLDGGLVSRLASPFFVLMLTSPHLALSLLLADYSTAISTTSVATFIWAIQQQILHSCFEAS